ncbi:hypothetical protein LCGC14_1869180 [marine sediment metagenome]|uniref:HNH nuclease domain-containing protein n=1 Tax=marine sediment metagenome TaxID=412755 RepID=A0A0F9IJK2_9ZZZZ
MPKGKKFTPEQLHFLEEQYQKLTVADLSVAFNKRYRRAQTPGSIKVCLRNHRIRCDHKSKGYRGQLMNAKQYAWVKERYREIPRTPLTAEFNAMFGKNITVVQMTTFLKNHGVLSGRDGKYKEGRPSTPAMRAALMRPGQTNSTSFKPGPRPDQERPMWSERVDTKGSVWLKIPEADPHRPGVPYRWVPKAPVVWEQANGPKPPKHIITFKDCDQLNCDLGNLICISRQLLFRLNKYDYMRQPAALRPSIFAIAELEVALFARQKEHAEGDHG